jgi:hypothetical protein
VPADQEAGQHAIKGSSVAVPGHQPPVLVLGAHDLATNIIELADQCGSRLAGVGWPDPVAVFGANVAVVWQPADGTGWNEQERPGPRDGAMLGHRFRVLTLRTAASSFPSSPSSDVGATPTDPTLFGATDDLASGHERHKINARNRCWLG